MKNPKNLVEYGIAAQYVEDEGIKEHPAVLFATHFEDKDWRVKDFGFDRPIWPNQGQRITNPKLMLTGQAALQYQNNKGTHDPTAIRMYWTDYNDVPPQDVVFVRWYRRYETGYDFSCQVKTNGIYGKSTKFIEDVEPEGAGASGYHRYSARLQLWKNGDGGEPRIYTYHIDQAGGYGDNLHQNLGETIVIKPGEWHSYELMLKTNDAGKRNGELKLWIDGVLRSHYPNMRFRHTNDLKINELEITAWTGGDCVAPKDQKVWDDNIVFATEYIGPMVTSDEIILDNFDAAFSVQGNWKEFTSVEGQHFGDTHYYKEDIGTGQNTATWSFTVPEPGLYDVYAWWWEAHYRPADVPYTINHIDDSSIVRVDQRTKGGQWNLLGSFSFQDDGSVVVSDDVSSGRDVVADAIRLVFNSKSPEPSRTEVVIDDADPGFSIHHTQDAWQRHVADDAQHYQGTHYYNRQSGGQDTATWSFSVPEPGIYDVYAWWHEGHWRPSDAPYTINHIDDSTIVRVDQRTKGGQWNLLGSFSFQDDGSVVVSDDVSSGRDVVADAIRLVFNSKSPEPSRTEVVIDDADPVFSIHHTQDAWQRHVADDAQHYQGTHYYNRQSGGQDTATWSFSVPEPGIYDVYAWWHEGHWRPSDVPYTINHIDDSTIVRVDQRTKGGQWNLLGSFHFQTQGSVVLADDVSSGRDAVADAIRLVFNSEPPEPSRTEVVIDDADPGFLTYHPQNEWQEQVADDARPDQGTQDYNQQIGGQDTAIQSFSVPEAPVSGKVYLPLIFKHVINSRPD